ncbi:MAG: DNA adenine methylase [Caldilineaceae bacterium]|nr:DNA adenine methylase [Caldilineaceae bacterium]
MAIQIDARPFLKWAGGKSQLLAQFVQRYPPELAQGNLTRYAEPFLGGGAVFLELAQRYGFEHALLNDINPELVLVYQVVQQRAAQLIEYLEKHERIYRSADEEERNAYFYRVRDAYNAQRSKIDFTRFSEAWVTRAGYMIFLNKTCFNGLFRVNRKGEFNVPFGRYRNPNICDSSNLLRVSELLQCAVLQVGPFTSCESFIDDSTFVYFDPPYRPISQTSSFTSYSSDRFNDYDQAMLAKFFTHLSRTTKAKLMLSNSDPRALNPEDYFFEDLYEGFRIHRVWASRMINSQADKRGKITELLITNY